MVANAAFLAAVVMLAVALELMDQLTFLAPYKHFIVARYLWTIVGAAIVLFLNLVAVFFWLGRWLWLKDTGRKLAFLDRQLKTPDTIARELSDRLSRQP